ncbi:MAG: hypothetical protein K9J12_04880 [Melioribacteraceae bacterium]|nr:hypothetical protein [Melioribacteraceae bacterium]MCF8264482.1 hypothetical protein [Melioribacteraceae bacterium]MCF8411931.1 hypothetical protein [Melioribacteraceae bacterium]MCF8430934.1 hypothetical protein [Melioribacteraceae bacterium]
MKTSLFLFFISITLIAQEQGTGIGLISGAPTGFSLKHWVNETEAYDAGIGFSFAADESLSMHLDYIYHHEGLLDLDIRLPIYYGFGGRYRVKKNTDDSFGARGVIGALAYLKDYPVDIFVEIAPIFQIMPKTKLGLDAGIGIRYFFNSSEN